MIESPWKALLEVIINYITIDTHRILPHACVWLDTSNKSCGIYSKTVFMAVILVYPDAIM